MSALDLQNIVEKLQENTWQFDDDCFHDLNAKSEELNAEISKALGNLWMNCELLDINHPQIPDWILRCNELEREYEMVNGQVRAKRFRNAFLNCKTLGPQVDARLDENWADHSAIFQLFEEIEESLNCDHYRIGGDPGMPAWLARIQGMDYMSFREWFRDVTLEMVEDWVNTMKDILGVQPEEDGEFDVQPEDDVLDW
jgi:hypothetical protein